MTNQYTQRSVVYLGLSGHCLKVCVKSRMEAEKYTEGDILLYIMLVALSDKLRKRKVPFVSIRKDHRENR